MTVAPDMTLATPRLLLRPTSPGDALDFVRIQSNWKVMRMLRLADFPATLETMGAWLDGHAEDWRAGSAYRFAVLLQDRVVGSRQRVRVNGPRPVAR